MPFHFTFFFSLYVPATLIFICFIVFHLKITTGPLYGYVLFCQLTLVYLNYGKFIYEYIQSNSTHLRVFFGLSVTITEFWSLQFFQAILPPLCISEKLTGIHVQMLNFIPTVYPFVLVIISCILMELHARNYRIVGILWKPFKIILSKANITEVTGDAVFHAFASHIFLSNITVLIATSHVEP